MNLLKFALPHNLAREFKEQMMMRNYNGSLIVDHNVRVITLSVETHKVSNDNDNVEDEEERTRLQRNKKQRTNKRVIQDLKGKLIFS